MSETIVDGFEDIVNQHGDLVALIDDRGETLSYRDLNSQANRVANIILSRAGSENDPVMLIFEHSRWRMLAALLGTMKARKIAVPINPYPVTKDWGHRGYVDLAYLERFVRVLDPVLLLTDNANGQLGKEVSGERRVINLDLGFSDSEHNPGINVLPEDRTAIFHTSGTSGQPKAVVHTHEHEIWNMGVSISQDPLWEPGDRSTLFRVASSAAFNDAIFALLHGVTLCLFDLNHREKLAEWVIEKEITIWRSVATVFRFLIHSGFPSSLPKGFPKIKTINIGGEIVTDADAEVARTWFENAKFTARYASTETGTIAMGKPGALIPVEDRKITINPDGEIVVESNANHIGRYFGKASPRLVHTGEGRMVYYTGDRGELREDGSLVHLGRIQ